MNRQHAAPALLSRRAFVQGAGVAGLGLLAACGAPAARRPRVGWLWPWAPNTNVQFRDSFIQGLLDHGYIDGQTVAIDLRDSEGQAETLPALARDLVGSSPDVVVVDSLPGAQAVQQATSTLPIVVAIVNDPVGMGLVASLAHPGGNLTGLAAISPELAAKRLQLLQEVTPGLARVAVLWNASNPEKVPEFDAMAGAAHLLGLELLSLAVHSATDFAPVLARANHERADALVVLGDPLAATARPAIAAFAAEHALPTITASRVWAAAGFLMSYGPDFTAMYRRAAYYVDRILKGTKPADLPVEQPREFDFVINLQTAQALGLTIPQHVLLQATEVIQ